MAREKRQTSPTGIYHILLRGIDELFSETADFEKFVELSESYFDGVAAELLGYALMKNRAHMIIKEGQKSVSMMMKPLCTSYARYFNRVHNLQGKLFYDRYKSEPINDEKDLEDLKAFMNAVPCDLKNEENKTAKPDGLYYIDDYCRMTDEELKSYIEDIFEIDIKRLSNDERENFSEKIIDGRKIGVARIYKIFDTKMLPKDKKTEPKVEEKIEEKKKDNNLSVWLL